MDQMKPNRNNLLLTGIVDGLLTSYYDEASRLNHLHEYALPSLQATLQVLRDIKDVLFPDHRLGRQIRSGQTPYIIGGILEKIHDELRRQVYLAIAHDQHAANPCPVTLDEAERITLAFLGRLPELREILSLDVQAALDGDPAAKSFDEIIFCYPGLEAIATYRIAHVLHGLNVPLLPRIMAEYAHGRTGTDIHPGAHIGKSFFIDHATGVVIGETTLIGERVKLYQGVTLGALSFPRDSKGELLRNVKRHPTIEDDVVIYAGATILGGETVIGRGAVIGGSCWITHSIPPGTKVILQEPQMKVSGPQPPPSHEPDWCI